MTHDNGWQKWQEHVLNELERQGREQNNLSAICQQILCDIATLKVKSGIWGLIGGFIPVAIMVGFMLLRK